MSGQVAPNSPRKRFLSRAFVTFSGPVTTAEPPEAVPPAAEQNPPGGKRPGFIRKALSSLGKATPRGAAVPTSSPRVGAEESRLTTVGEDREGRSDQVSVLDCASQHNVFSAKG